MRQIADPAAIRSAQVSKAPTRLNGSSTFDTEFDGCRRRVGAQVLQERPRDKFWRRESGRQGVKRANRVRLKAVPPCGMQFFSDIVSKRRRAVYQRQQMIPVTVIVGKDVDRRYAILAFLAPELIGEALGKDLGRRFEQRGHRQKIVVRKIRAGDTSK